MYIHIQKPCLQIRPYSRAQDIRTLIHLLGRYDKVTTLSKQQSLETKVQTSGFLIIKSFCFKKSHVLI